MVLAYARRGPDLVGTRPDWAGQVLVHQASPDWLWLDLPGSGRHWALVSLALPMSDLDHCPQLVQLAKPRPARESSLLSSLSLTWPDVTWSWLYLGLAPAWLGLGCDWPGRVLTLEGLAMFDLNLTT